MTENTTSELDVNYDFDEVSLNRAYPNLPAPGRSEERDKPFDCTHHSRRHHHHHHEPLEKRKREREQELALYRDKSFTCQSWTASFCSSKRVKAAAPSSVLCNTSSSEIPCQSSQLSDAAVCASPCDTSLQQIAPGPKSKPKPRPRLRPKPKPCARANPAHDASRDELEQLRRKLCEERAMKNVYKSIAERRDSNGRDIKPWVNWASERRKRVLSNDGGGGIGAEREQTSRLSSLNSLGIDILASSHIEELKHVRISYFDAGDRPAWNLRRACIDWIRRNSLDGRRCVNDEVIFLAVSIMDKVVSMEGRRSPSEIDWHLLSAVCVLTASKLIINFEDGMNLTDAMALCERSRAEIVGAELKVR